MNHIYRIVWNQVLNAWVAVAESARGRGKGSSRKLVAAALSLTASFAQAAPAGGQVVSGAGNIAQSGNTTTITQSTQNLSLNWQSFNIAKSETVNFVQPSASAIAVNRIFDTNGSQILGQLNANGQVYLINPNGILFGQGAQVNVGSLVASTLDLNDASLNSAMRSFSGTGTGSIVNQGTINAASGGYVALLGNTVSNQGTITTPLGTVALGAGNAVTLNFNGNSLVKMQIDQSVLNSQAENGGLIRADGGLVVMNAGAKDALLASVVNNTGVIEARTVENHEGTIILLGGMVAGTVNVGGTLNASAPNGGNGGFIETSAAQVKIANDVKITTAAATGTAGHWLIDPVDFTIAVSNGNITGANLGTLLASNSITIQTATGTNSASNLYGAAGSNGDINVNDAVNWSANNTLTLDAYRNININQSITATGSSGKLALKYGQGAADGVMGGVAATYNVNASVNLKAGNNFSTQLGSTGSVKNYTVITSLGAQGSTTATDLQGISGGLTGNYVLGSNLDATATASWNGNAGFNGFMPIGNLGTPFTGTFDGLGHTISNLSIDQSTTGIDSAVGLFGVTSSTSSIRNVGLLNPTVRGFDHSVGALVGNNMGLVSHVFVEGTNGSVTAGSTMGGLVGYNQGTIEDSHSSITVSGWNRVGGLVGTNTSVITRSYSNGQVYANHNQDLIGGLVGQNNGAISDSYATGNVGSSSSSVGGLVGGNWGTVDRSYATGSVTGSTSIGGLVGYNANTIRNSFWDTTTGPQNSAGGTSNTTAQLLIQSTYSGWDFINTWYMVDGSTRPFLRSEYSTTITNAHQLQLMRMNLAANYTLVSNLDVASALVAPRDMWGGSSAGFAPIGSQGSKFTGSFDGLSHTISGITINQPLQSYVGLFGVTAAGSAIRNVGLINGSISGGSYVGGLVGSNGGLITNSFATVSVNGASYVGGLVGYMVAGSTINDAYTAGTVNSQRAGGLVGRNEGTISNSYATGAVTGNYSSGLTGLNDGGGVVTDSFWNTETTGKTSSTGGTGLTTAEMMQLASFSSWNAAAPNTIANTGSSGAVWRIYEGHSAPLLTSFMKGLTLTGAPDVSGTYNGNSQSGASISAPNGVVGSAATGINAGFYNGYYSTQQGYDISGGNLTINAAALSAISQSGTRAYDGTVDVAANIFTLSGLVSGQHLTLTGSGTVADKNVGSNKTVTLGSLTLGNGSGGLASNYTFTGGTQTATITAKALTMFGLTASNKVYDANTSAVLGGTAAVTALSGDVVTLTGTASGLFADKNAASNKAVTVSGITLGGTDAGNYNLLQQTGLSATISKAQLSYTAAPANFLNGQTPNDLSGTVNGFAAGDTLTNSTSDHLAWTTPANASSKPGSYAIEGNGLLASNYSFSQAAPNSTALTLAPATPPTPVLNATTQLASISVSPQASAQPTVLSMSPAIMVTQSNSVETAGSSTGSSSKPDNVASANTSMTIGSTGPALQIVNGGMRLPVAMVNVNE